MFPLFWCYFKILKKHLLKKKDYPAAYIHILFFTAFFLFVFVFLFYVGFFFWFFFFVCLSVYFFHWDFRLAVLWYTIVKVLCWYLAPLFVFVGLLLWIRKLETKKKKNQKYSMRWLVIKLLPENKTPNLGTWFFSKNLVSFLF